MKSFKKQQLQQPLIKKQLQKQIQDKQIKQQQNKQDKQINQDVLNNIFSFVTNTEYDYSILFTNPYYKKNIHQKYKLENIDLLFLSFTPLQQYINELIGIDESKASTIEEVYEYLSICYNKDITYIKNNMFTKKQLFNLFTNLSENIENIIISRENKYIKKYKKEYKNLMKDMN
jgi:hypothetical protein